LTKGFPLRERKGGQNGNRCEKNPEKEITALSLLERGGRNSASSPEGRRWGKGGAASRRRLSLEKMLQKTASGSKLT